MAAAARDTRALAKTRERVFACICMQVSERLSVSFSILEFESEKGRRQTAATVVVAIIRCICKYVSTMTTGATTSRANVESYVYEERGMLPACCASRLINRANSGTNLKPVYVLHAVANTAANNSRVAIDADSEIINEISNLIQVIHSP